MKLKFAHLADLHLGSFREKRLTELNLIAFQKAVDKIIYEKVDFCLFSGDIFNNSMPQFEIVSLVLEEFMRLKNRGIKVYVIGGSHDYSLNGKSFIELLDKAQVFVDVFKYDLIDKNKYRIKVFSDDKLKINVCGILGRKLELEKELYKNLIIPKMDENYFNVFMFHSTLNDLKPDFMKSVEASINSSMLPANFNYYAGGHIHTQIIAKCNSGVVSYPGALFPNNFSELKKERCGFNLCEFDFSNREVSVKRVDLDVYRKEYILVEIDNLNPIDCKNLIIKKIENLDLKDKLVLLEIKGVVDGKINDISLNSIVNFIYEKGAFYLLKNTYKLTSSLTLKEDIEIKEDIELIEDDLIKKQLGTSLEFEKEYMLVKNLLKLDLSKYDEEKNINYEQRVIEAIDKSLK